MNRTLISINSLLDALANTGKLQQAKSVFDAMPKRDCYSWNTMLTAYANHGHLVGLKALLASASDNGIAVDAMINCYSQLGKLVEARRSFDFLEQRNSVSWVTMITAYSRHGHLQSAEVSFDRMPYWTVVAFNVLLGLFLKLRHYDKAVRMFDLMPQRSIVSYTALVAGYANTGHLERAKYVFDRMPVWNTVAWNGLMAAYAHAGHLAEAKHIFDTKVLKSAVSGTLMMAALAMNGHLEDVKLVFHGLSGKDGICWCTLLHACIEQENGSNIEDVKKAYDRMPHHNLIASTTLIRAYGMHGYMEEAAIVFAALPCQDSPSWNALLSTYARNGHFSAAELIFDRLPQRDVITWNSMLSGYVQCGKHSDAKVMFDRMPQRDVISWTCMLSTGGQGVDQRIPQWSLSMLNIVLARYAHKGDVVKAKAAFDRMPGLDVVSWTSLLAGYAQNGHFEDAFGTYRSMHLEGMSPNSISVTCVLVSCSHAGTVKDGRDYFQSMLLDHGMQACRDHYSCMVDMLGRAGHLQDAEDLVENMPFLPDKVIWNCLLGACTSHNDVERAKRASKHAMGLDSSLVSSYVLLSNVWSSLKLAV